MRNSSKGQGRSSGSKRPKSEGGDSARASSSKQAVKNVRARPNPAVRSGGKKTKTVATAPEKHQSSMRIAKAIAAAGLCSRRDAERWIAEGRVVVNGKRIDSPALNVGTSDKVAVDGKALPTAQPVRLWRFHKPRGLITTHNDPQGRETVFDRLPADMPRVISIGRLDYNTEGLLLFTTSGELARHIELPATGWQRRYRVRGFGRVTQNDLDELKEGIVVDGVRYGPMEATLDSLQSGNCWLTIGLREGKNREVRKVLESLGLKVNRLIRLSFGPFELRDLPAGDIAEVQPKALASHFSKDVAQRLNLPPGKVASQETTRPPRPQRPRRDKET